MFSQKPLEALIDSAFCSFGNGAIGLFSRLRRGEKREIRGLYSAFSAAVRYSAVTEA